MGRSGSDAIDEVKANMLGWTSQSSSNWKCTTIDSPGYGRFGGAVKDRQGGFVCGYHPLFLLAKCGIRLARKPYVVGSMALLYGFVSSYIKGVPGGRSPAD